MKHHFADFLYREEDYWTTIPNRERFAYSANEDLIDKHLVKIITINKHDNCWRQVFDCHNIEEITLHDASKEQIQAIGALTKVKRLRITFLRTNDLHFLKNLINIEELILEYVSGFSDLSPLLMLTKLKSLHLENLRRVSNFDGLRGLNSLRYLYISGTLDWSQPIENFNFLEGIPNLEIFSLGFIINRSQYPALLPILSLKSLKKIQIGRSTFNVKEYALLEAAIPHIDGAKRNICWEYNNRIEFIGKHGGWVSVNSPLAKQRCEEFIQEYEKMKMDAEIIINKEH